ncbi:MAG: NifU N-terminal domain-containing protein [Planctomycetota bacterium]
MSYTVRDFEQTPNVNAIKCLVEPAPTAAPRSYFNAEQAAEAGDGLAEALFGIEGVTNVLIHVAFITIGKRAEADWRPIRKAVKAVLEGFDG